VSHQTLTETDTFSSEINPCNGEPFTATAQFTFSTTILETPSGNDINADLGEFNGSGVGATGAREDGSQDDFFFHAVFVAIIDLDTLTVAHETTHFSTECR
jgi:hypothetical protein